MEEKSSQNKMKPIQKEDAKKKVEALKKEVVKRNHKQK